MPSAQTAQAKFWQRNVNAIAVATTRRAHLLRFEPLHFRIILAQARRSPSRVVNAPLTANRYSDAVYRNSLTKEKRRGTCDIDHWGYSDGTRRPAWRRSRITFIFWAPERSSASNSTSPFTASSRPRRSTSVATPSRTRRRTSSIPSSSTRLAGCTSTRCRWTS